MPNRMLETIDVQSEFGVAAAIEAKRLAEKYGKDYFDCNKLIYRELECYKSNIRKNLYRTKRTGIQGIILLHNYRKWKI